MYRTAHRVLNSSIKIAKRRGITPATTSSMSTNIDSYKFETLSVSQPKSFVLHVEFNRGDKMNSM
uniref:Uncharacterized protein n=1 Tax=Ciona savignyi TaxID=51511 RepID=H2Z621_CIOSA